MRIYSGGCFGEKFEKLNSMNLGIMISSVYDLSLLRDYWKKVPCALDNGAFSDYSKGLDTPFDEHRFLQTFSKVNQLSIRLDFAVLPDVVGGGMGSLIFSMRWAERMPWVKWALAVQDGMDDIEIPIGVSHIFVGGSEQWKWATAERWVVFAHSRGLKCHIGRCGTLEKLRYAKSIGADSIDSTSFTRNDAWHIIEEFKNPKQLSMEGL